MASNTASVKFLEIWKGARLHVDPQLTSSVSMSRGLAYLV